MADSIDSARKASNFGATTKKQKQSAGKAPLDTPEAREARIRLYMSRANVNPDSERHERKTGSHGRPISIFNGEEVSEEELKVVEIEDDEMEDE